MTTWPELNEHGDLPVDIYKAGLDEVIEHFGQNTPERRALARRLSRIYRLVTDTGHLHRFIIFGSFVTAKAAPNDIDIFMLMEDSFDVDQLAGETAIIFDHMMAHNYEGASIFWIRRQAAIGGEQSATEHWQIKRDGARRGIIEVIRND